MWVKQVGFGCKQAVGKPQGSKRAPIQGRKGMGQTVELERVLPEEIMFSLIKQVRSDRCLNRTIAYLRAGFVVFESATKLS